jgi:hypothetical protein
LPSSTPGAAQQNGEEISIDGRAKGKGKAGAKKRREEKKARDPRFD